MLMTDERLISRVTGKSITTIDDGGACGWPRANPPISPIGPHWHVVHSDVKHAAVAIKAMKRIEYEVYYPEMRMMKTPPRDQLSAKQRKQMHLVARPVLAPLFPGYIFARFDLQSGRWHELFEVFGVNGMVVTGGLPAPVNDRVIQVIRGLEIGGAIPLDTPVKALLFKVGETVRIDEGPFMGFPGTVQELDESAQRVLLDILIFGRPTPVSLDASQVSAIQTASR